MTLFYLALALWLSCVFVQSLFLDFFSTFNFSYIFPPYADAQPQRLDAASIFGRRRAVQHFLYTLGAAVFSSDR